MAKKNDWLINQMKQIAERQLAECDTAEVNTVIMSNFQRTYRSLVSRQKETRRLPSEVKQMLEAKLNNPLLIEKGDYE